MSAHLSAQEMIRYRERKLSPPELISACDHLASCAKCRTGVSNPEQLQSAFDALGPMLHEAAVSGLPRPELSLPTRAWSNLATAWQQQPLRTLGQTLVVVLLVVLCVLALIQRTEIRRLKAGVTSLESQNGDLRTQLRELDGLKAELAALRKSSSSGSDTEFDVALKDAGALVGMDKQGELVGLQGLSPAQQSLIKTALTAGRVKMPGWISEVAGGDGPLMGGSEKEPFRLTSPVGTATRTNRPAFRWTPLAGATSYKIAVHDSNFKIVAVSDSISGTEWTPSQALKRGVIYTWEVTALKDGNEITAPAPPAKEASFRILDSATLTELERAGRENGQSHLLLGVLAANAGLLDEAEREFQLLANANPDSPLPGKLRASLKSLRTPK